MTDIKEKINTALQFHSEGKLEEAETLYIEAMSEDPTNANVLNLYGLLKYQQKHYEDAAMLVEQAVEIAPSAYFYGNLGRIYDGNGEIKKAIDCYKKAIVLDSTAAELWFQLAILFRKSGADDSAIKSYQKTIELKQDFGSAYFNLGNIYAAKNKIDEAIVCFKKLIALNPNDGEAKEFLAKLYFVDKNFEAGRKLFEDRVSKKFAIMLQQKTNSQIAHKSTWNGSSLEGKTIYCYYEGGLGDTMQFVRYLPIVAKRAAKTVFLPQPSLVKLLRDSNLGIEILDNTVFDLPFDEHISLMSLPDVLNLDFNHIPFFEGYLSADKNKIDFYKERYFNNNKLKIGIKWQGTTFGLANRAIPLECFYKLLDLSGCEFYSFQKDAGTEQLSTLPPKYKITDLGPTFNDFADTAAALKNLDLFICNDTSLAHLAGALGVKTFILLPFQPEWRWFLNTETTPWYKSAKLFRQRHSGDWNEIFDQIIRRHLKNPKF